MEYETRRTRAHRFLFSCARTYAPDNDELSHFPLSPTSAENVRITSSQRPYKSLELAYGAVRDLSRPPASDDRNATAECGGFPSQLKCINSKKKPMRMRARHVCQSQTSSLWVWLPTIRKRTPKRVPPQGPSVGSLAGFVISGESNDIKCRNARHGTVGPFRLP